VSFTHNVHVVPRGQSWHRGHQILIADRADNLRVAWRDTRKLELCFNNARVFHFTNFWHASEVENFAYVVDIRLVEPAAACAPASLQSRCRDVCGRRSSGLWQRLR